MTDDKAVYVRVVPDFSELDRITEKAERFLQANE